MKKIDLNDWIESGRGGRGASFFHKDDPDYMLKFDNLLTDPSSMEEELSAASVAYSLGISTPEPGEVVTDGKRYGLTFRRIPDKVSYARAIGDNPERLEELAKEFAVQTRKLHAIDADTTRMRNIKDIYHSLISRNTLHGPAIISHALELLDSLPEDRTCVHGDLHFGNIILSHGKSYFIDMGNFSYGCPLFDHAMLKSVCQTAAIDPDFFKEMFHFEPKLADRFWALFVKEYYAQDEDIRSIDEMVKPYVVLRKLTMEVESGIPLPMPALLDVYEMLN
ncbi:MAG: phosphotransferase [Bacteroidales bacterium]|nr:phosphotransferase [Bacteroidales bacterium]